MSNKEFSATPTPNGRKCILRNVPATWTNVAKPGVWEGKETRYEYTMKLTAEDIEAMAAATRDQIDNYRTWLLGTERGRKLNQATTKKLQNLDPVEFWSEKEQDDGTFKIKATRSLEKGKPSLVDSQKNPTSDEPGQGSLCNLVVAPQVYANGPNMGLRLDLEAVQIVERSSASDDFFEETEGGYVSEAAPQVEDTETEGEEETF